MIEFNGRNLKLPNGRSITLMREIKEVVESPHGVLVMVNWDEGYYRNVFLVGYSGEFKWQIELFSNHPKAGSIPYTGIWNKSGLLAAYNSAGVYCELDAETGKVTKKEFVK